jgi:hypothetical protein
MHFSEADISWYWIAIALFWILKAIFGGKKKKNQQNQPNTNSEPENQPGKSITDILKELEERVTGETKRPQYQEPELVKDVAPAVAVQKTTEDYKREKHSDMAKHHVTKAKLTDGKFDEIDHKLMHLEAFELDAHQPIDQAALSIEDMRRAVILDAVLNRPEW